MKLKNQQRSFETGGFVKCWQVGNYLIQSSSCLWSQWFPLLLFSHLCLLKNLSLFSITLCPLFISPSGATQLKFVFVMCLCGDCHSSATCWEHLTKWRHSCGCQSSVMSEAAEYKDLGEQEMVWPVTVTHSDILGLDGTTWQSASCWNLGYEKVKNALLCTLHSLSAKGFKPFIHFSLQSRRLQLVI